MSFYRQVFDSLAKQGVRVAATLTLVALPSAAVAGGPPLQTAARVVPPQVAATPGAKIIVAGLDDIVLGTWPGSGDLQGLSQHCVGTNSNPRVFGIVVTGSGAGGSFVLSNGVSALPFTVQYDDGSGATTVTPGVTLANRAAQAFGECKNINAENMQISVRILSSDLSTATPGSYSGGLTLTVTPE